MKKTIAVGDLHLTRDTPPHVAGDLVRLVRENPGDRLMLAGDLFDLSADFPRTPPLSALKSALDAQAPLFAALGEHVDRGGELFLVAGNHDAAIGEPDAQHEVLAALGVHGEARARVRTSPWFLEADSVHLEHGHFYDADNAPAHPLFSCVRSLGVHFVEEFIAPTGAFRYLNANDEMPLKLLISAFRWYGPRGPYVVYRYFRAAFHALARSGPFVDPTIDLERGRAREKWFAEEHALSEALLSELARLGATPTMSSLNATFRRLYLDRVAATLMLASGIGLAARGKTSKGALVLGAGAALMATSWALGYDRYGGTVQESLAKAAETVGDATGARLVVFGHAHRVALTPRYANTASFAFPGRAPGRPYLQIETTPSGPVATHRYLGADSR